VLDVKEDSVFKDDARFLRYPPKVVLVQLYEWADRDDKLVQEPCAWHIDGMDKYGVYPIRPWKRAWFLDQRRFNPQLQVKRFQVPLAPVYSMTAHCAQGRTLASAIIDVQIGRGVSLIASYVAMTRVRTRLDVLIYRNFEREVFTEGEPEGPALLLKVLRGEDVDLKAVEDKHTPKRMCSGPCLSVRFKDEFGAKQWKNAKDPLCKACVQKLQEQGTPYRCTRCRQWFVKESLHSSFLQQIRAESMLRLCCSPCPSVLHLQKGQTIH
jgi:hypothetical protein